MNPAHPAGGAVVPDAPFAPIFAGDVAVRIATHQVAPVDAADVRGDRQFGADCRGADHEVVGIEPADPLGGRPVEGELAGGREGVTPGKVVDLV